MKKLLIASVVAVGALTATMTVAQETNLTPAQQAEGRITLETARNLISYGQTKKDGLALVTAAKMMAGVPGRVLADGQDGNGGPNFDLETILKQAEQLSEGDENIKAIANKVREMAAEDDRAVCYWQYYCYWNGWCEYSWVCF